MRVNDGSDVPHNVLEVPAWLMQWVNSGEWGGDLPPHPSPVMDMGSRSLTAEGGGVG